MRIALENLPLLLLVVQMFIQSRDLEDRETQEAQMSVCLSVCLYVCHSRPALTTPTIFLIFGMKLGDH